MSKTFQELTQEMISQYHAGNFATALEVVEQGVDQFPEESTRITFWRICLLSRCNRIEAALSAFRLGLEQGHWWAADQLLDTDLDPLRELPEFKELTSISLKRLEQARPHMKRERTLVLPDAQPATGYPLLIALHGRSGKKESNLEQWDVARRRGWLILSPQSTQPLFTNAYCWDDPEQGVQDILFHFKEIQKDYPIDQKRILVGGMSQGSGMAIYVAFNKTLSACGFIGAGTWWFDVDSLAAQVQSGRGIRGYFVTGEKDHTLERAREIQSMLKINNIQFGEEVHPDLGHDFPSDFETSFDRAIDFIFKE